MIDPRILSWGDIKMAIIRATKDALSASDVESDIASSFEPSLSCTVTKTNPGYRIDIKEENGVSGGTFSLSSWK